MKIYKSQIVEVISRHRLVPGNFDDGHGNRCVIGQLVRTLNPTMDPEQINNASEFLTKFQAMSRKPLTLARNGNLFGALSALFENVTFDAGDVVTQDVRQELLTFVNNQFPEVIEIPPL